MNKRIALVALTTLSVAAPAAADAHPFPYRVAGTMVRRSADVRRSCVPVKHWGTICHRGRSYRVHTMASSWS